MEIKKTSKLMIFPRVNKIVIIIFAIALVIAGLRGGQLYTYVFQANVKTAGGILIPRNATFDQVCDSLKKHHIISNYRAFNWVAKKKKYAENIKSGYFTFKPGMGTNQIVNKLISGAQTPIDLTFNNIRLTKNLAVAVSKYIEADSITLFNYLSDEATIRKYGFNKQTFPCMFIPNTYQFYWTTTAEKFVDRMWAEYKSFWNEGRKAKAAAIGLSPEEVAIIASIVQEETAKSDERARVAGLYLNRIKRGMPLQADPTVKFALGDFTIRRVLISHLSIDSPYNTYKNSGLPPGPINFPEISNLDAVLNAEKHQYLFMCAKEDFSGYHNFARTLAEHSQNAARYQQALNRNKIWK